MTKLDTRRKNLKKLGEWEDKIKEMGHDSEERGIKAVRELHKEDDKKQDKQKHDALEVITRKRKFSDNEYLSALCGWGAVVLQGISLPKGTKIRLTQNFRDSKKIEVWIYAKDQGWYARGINPSFEPIFDMRAVEDKVMDAIDYLDILVKPPEGILDKNGRKLN